MSPCLTFTVGGEIPNVKSEAETIIVNVLNRDPWTGFVPVTGAWYVPAGVPGLT